MISGYILVFTTSSAFDSERILKNAQINIKLVPTPREFSSDCGIAVLFNVENEQLEIMQSILDKENIEYEIKIIAKA